MKKVTKLLALAALTCLFGTVMTGQAKADWGPRGEWHDRGWHGHEAYHHAHPQWGPYYVAAPPPVVYYPPPPSPGINLIVPLHFN